MLIGKDVDDTEIYIIMEQQGADQCAALVFSVSSVWSCVPPTVASLAGY